MRMLRLIILNVNWLVDGWFSIASTTESLGAESVESGLGLSLSDEFSEHFQSQGFLIMYNVLIYHNAVFVCENLDFFQIKSRLFYSEHFHSANKVLITV